MSLSRSPMWTQRSGAPISSVDRRRLSSQRTLSFRSIGTRVGLIFRFSAAVPLNLSRDQTFTAVRPNGSPSGLTARLACSSRPHSVCWRKRPSLSFRPVGVLVKPIFSGAARVKENSVVSCNTRIGPSMGWTRRAGAWKWKWQASIVSSLTFSFEKKR